jgi:hypothetical protein
MINESYKPKLNKILTKRDICKSKTARIVCNRTIDNGRSESLTEVRKTLTNSTILFSLSNTLPDILPDFCPKTNT